ncbi:MAG: Nif3-like dinuclear metal center hexameric protein [Bacteroidota bacterium]|nr:Nif3-like dinuclear metal center hexameric protein [Bacteroidota bacterium]
MLIKVEDIIKILESIAPLSWQEDYDNAGLIIGNPNNEIKGILICLDVFPSTVQEAIDNNCNMIISHHPFIFRGLKKLIYNSYTTDILSLSFNNDISIYASHTNMDSCSTGVNYMLANVLRLNNLRPLQNISLQDENYIGSGAIGELLEAMTGKMFFDLIKKKLNLPYIKYIGNINQEIKTIGICGGAGASFLQEAINNSCDCYLTSDIKYHDFLSTEERILLADIGHFESEQFVLQRFQEIIKNSFPFSNVIISQQKNKIKFY